MSQVRQWTVQRPRWVALLGGLLYGGGLASLGYCLSGVYPAAVVAALIALLAALVHARHKRQGGLALNGLLSVNNENHWEYALAGSRRPLLLSHAWSGFAWITLRFSDPTASNLKDTMLELTIWKSSVTPDAWRQLCVYIAGEITSPGQSTARRI